MKYIDFHCDTLSAAFYKKKTDICTLTDTMVNAEKLKTGECAAQFFAIFMLPEDEKKKAPIAIPEDYTYISELKNILDNTVAGVPYIEFARNFEEMKANSSIGTMSAFLTLEDGRAVRGNMSNLEEFYNMGVRLISLTWNYANCFGFPNSVDKNAMALGLTDFGKEAVEWMNELGMLVDVSHLSDGGFWDVMEISKQPVIASHSNCRTLSPHQRNLTDEMIRALADKGGVSGLNFCPAFINEDINCTKTSAGGIAKQAMYMANCGGIEVLAIGSDFDGIGGEHEVDGPDKMCLLWDALTKVGFKNSEIEKIAYKNAERIIRDTLR